MTKFCVSCGAELNSNKKFCEYCGKVNKSSGVFSNKINDENINDYTRINDNFKEKSIEKESSRKPAIAFLFAILFGPLGVHNFYYGQYVLGFIKLFLYIFSFGTIGFILYPISFIEGLLMLSGTIKPRV